MSIARLFTILGRLELHTTKTFHFKIPVYAQSGFTIVPSTNTVLVMNEITAPIFPLSPSLPTNEKKAAEKASSHLWLRRVIPRRGRVLSQKRTEADLDTALEY